MRKWLVLFACVATSGAFAAQVSKPELTLDAPDGWVEVPSEVLRAFYDELKRQTPLGQVPKYDYAFQAAAGPPWLSYPYVLVKVTPGGRPSEHDLETLPTIDLNSKVREQREGWSNLMKDTSLGQMRYDKAANIVWLSSKSDVVGIGPVTGLSGMIPTEQGFVELHGYAKAPDFPQYLPTFEKVIQSARVAPALAYRPHWTDKLGPLSHFNFKEFGFVVVLGALIGVFVSLYRRKKA